MNGENEKKYNFAETDRVMEQLKARLAEDAVSAASTEEASPEKEAHIPEAAQTADQTGDAPQEQPAAPEEAEKRSAEPAPAEEAAPEQTAPKEEKPPLQELSYAHRGNVFAPFGFVEDRKRPEEAAPAQAAEAVEEQPVAAHAEKVGQPAAEAAPAEPEKPHKESRVFAPFGLKDTKIEATGLRAKVAEERAAKEAAEAERAAKEAELAEARRQAAEAAHKAEVITPTEVDYAQRGKVFAPFGFDPTGGKARQRKPETKPEPEPQTEEKPEEAAPIKEEKAASVDPAAPKKDKKSKKVENESPKLPKNTENVEKKAKSTQEAPTGTDIPAELNRKRVKSAAKPANVASGGRKAPTRRARQSEALAIHVVPNKKAPLYTGGEDSVTLQCDGQTVVIPQNTERFLNTAAKRSDAAPDQQGNRAAGELFSALAVTRPVKGSTVPKGTAGQATAEQMAFKRSMESSEEDFRLLLDLDYEKELGTAIGYEKIREYHERGLNGLRRDADKKAKGKKHFEYGSHAQDIVISKNYTKKRRRLTVNLIVTMVLLVLLFIYERLPFMYYWFGGQDAERYPALYVLLGLALFSVGVIILRHQLLNGFMQMVRLAPTDHSLCSVTVALTYLYHITLFFLPREGQLSLYLSPAASSMMLLALASLMDGHRESAAFRVVSSKQQKYALLTRVSVGNSDSGAADRLMRPERNEKTYYVRPVDFVRGYFTNTEKKTAHNSLFGSLLLLILSIGVALALYAGVMGAGARTVLHTAFVTVMLCLPAMSVLITSLPMFLAVLLRLKRKGAIIGEEAVYHTSESTALVLPESEIFLPMSHEQFELCQDADATRSAILIRALLERLDSPMVESVSVAPESRLSPTAVTLTEIERNGVSAVVIDGEGKKSTLLLGGVSYMEKYGIQVSAREAESEDLCKDLLCVSIDGKLTALFLARYRLHGEVLPLLHALSAEHVSLVVRTKDPGIYDEQLAHLTVDADGEIRVMKPLSGELELRTDRVEATVVALGSCREAARTYAACRRVRRAGSFGAVLQVLSTVFGVALCCLLTFFGTTARVPAFAVTLYMLFWCVLHGVVSYLYLREKPER